MYKQAPPMRINGWVVNGKAARLLPCHQGEYHAFVSHIWHNGQDVARSIKQLLKEVLPGVRVFLDVCK
jgi:hypothetical protein